LARGLLRMSAVQKAATAEDDAGGGSRATAQKITACGHEKCLPDFFVGLP